MRSNVNIPIITIPHTSYLSLKQSLIKMPSKKNVSDQYQSMTEIEHILNKPGMYIGSCQLIESDMFIADIASDLPKIVKKKMMFSAGLERIYEEILLNAFDQTVREGTGCTEIHVDIDQSKGHISVMNNGNGIPIVKKEELGCYIPEMLFGQLRTSSNYDDSEERITGGTNGLGGKLAVIFSSEFTIETIDSDQKKSYVQTWTDNMSNKTNPVIKACRKKPFTRISFKPDLSRFEMTSLGDDTIMLMKKRLIDIGFASNAKVKTFFNGTAIAIKKPEDYMKLYDYPQDEKFIVDDTNERWTVGVILSNDGYQHASFVNGIHTTNGGSHLVHVADQIAKEIIEKLKTKKVIVKPSDVKNRMFVFVKSAIVNPVFDSQSKESLKMAKTKFGSEYVMSDAFRKKLLTSSILKSMINVADNKLEKDLNKTSGTKKARLTDIDTLEDAAWAGTAKGSQTRLILTEGLSARTFAMSALNVIGRNCYGIFPLKGKLLNVRNVAISRVSANEEIKNIAKILGLNYSLKYETDAEMNTLRYGGVVSLTDSDLDGNHISGLIINYFHHFWPNLIQNGYVSFCITPIVKVFKGNDVLEFYTMNSYEEWIAKAKGAYRTKYFKGLGTSTAAEAREALKDIDSKLLKFQRDPNCDEHVSLAFNTKRADDRKTWLMERYDPKSSIDRNQREVGVSDFINYELSHFSSYDCARSIPSIMDGLKPSQRKIIHIAMKYASKNEIKVAQLAPKVSELTDYHHGEQSLMGAIIGLAQDYVGSNNINLLLPLGGFGTRLTNGADAASPRYIFTKMNPVAMRIFDSKDSTLLNYLQSDGSPIEPEWFAPVLPMILVNGTLGIGTGFSTSVLQYNPKDLIARIKKMLVGSKPKKTLTPWYKGFAGRIEQLEDSKYATYGVWKFDDKKNTLHVTELPINVATDSYKAICEKMLLDDKTPLSDVIYENTDVVVSIKFVFKPTEYAKIKSMSEEALVKEFKLSSKLSATNMYLFNAKGLIQKFADVYSIIDYYYQHRLDLYVKRRQSLIDQLEYEMIILRNKSKFIKFVKEGKIDQRTMTEASLLSALIKDFVADPRSTSTGLSAYDYLIGMTYRAFTEENKKRMMAAVKDKEKELEVIKATTSEQMWIDDLDAIEALL